MFHDMRRVFGPIAVSVIIGAIALVFVFYGVFNPKGSGGIRSRGGYAATVNGEGVSMQDFGREYQQRVEYYQNMLKGKSPDPKLLEQLGIRRQVMDELVRRKLMLQEARRLGMRVSDEELRDKIQEMPYFKKDGKFDAGQYRQILTANRLDPAVFEDMIREDLLRSQLVEFMRSRTRVSDNEVQSEFLSSEDRRQVDYVLISREDTKKLMTVSDKEVDELLKSEQGLNAVKTAYEQNKMDYMKPEAKPKKGAKEKAPGKPEFYSFDEVKRKVAMSVLKDRRSEELTKLTRDLANDVLAKAKAGDLKAAAKAKGLEARTSEKFNRTQNYIPGIGESADLLSDAFKDHSPINDGPKMYETAGNFVVVNNLKSFKPNTADFEKEREKLVAQVSMRKEQNFYENWMGDLRNKAKVSINESLLKEEAASDAQ